MGTSPPTHLLSRAKSIGEETETQPSSDQVSTSGPDLCPACQMLTVTVKAVSLPEYQPPAPNPPEKDYEYPWPTDLGSPPQETQPPNQAWEVRHPGEILIPPQPQSIWPSSTKPAPVPICPRPASHTALCWQKLSGRGSSTDPQAGMATSTEVHSTVNLSSCQAPLQAREQHLPWLPAQAPRQSLRDPSPAHTCARGLFTTHSSVALCKDHLFPVL